MKEIVTILNIVKIQSLLSKKFNALNMHGISLTDYMILHILNNATGNRLRRIDLAEKTGLTASGITRLLLPLEKIGLITKENNDRDARVSYVKLTTVGKKIFKDATITATSISTALLNNFSEKNMESFGSQLNMLGGDF